MLKFTLDKASKTSAGSVSGWRPPLVWDKKVPNTEVDKFRKVVERKRNLHFDSYRDFHKWSVENYADFWEEVWNYFDVISSKPYEQVVVKAGDGFLDYDWFPGAAMNYAENVLRIRDDRIALIYLDETGYEETVTFAEMFEEVKLYSAAFRKHGLKIGDVVACYMSNRKEALFAMLATVSIGAIWGAVQPFYGARSTAKILKMMDAKCLITIDHHQDYGKDYNLLENLPVIVENCPTLQKVIVIVTKEESLAGGISGIKNGCCLEEFLRSGRNPDGSVPDIVFEQLSFNHPICVSFTSGTTGLPKGPVHSGGTFLTFLATCAFHHNLSNGDVFLNQCPAGWTLWDCFIPSLALGTTIFLYCGSAYFVLNGMNIWDIIAKYKVTCTTLVTNMVEKLEKLDTVPSPSSNFENFKTLLICGSPVLTRNFQYIHNKITKDVFVGSQYGITESFHCFSGYDFNSPAYAGEIQALGLGLDIRVVNQNGCPVVGERGEIVIGTPCPSLPIYLWKDTNNSIMNATYFKKYTGVFCVGDEGWINPETKGLIVIGRSDDALIQNGERFGATDVYFAINEMKEIMDYICVNQSRNDGECRAVLFVKLKEGYEFTPELKAKIAETIERELWEDCVPEVILEAPDIPYNLNNKRMENLVRKIVATNQIPEVNNIKNPDSLKYFCDIPEILNYLNK
ncbi:acetoacetyl-CoA synthetase-like isoform X1 [Stegodyphus dumicola]|uniref:acetoacetyl-CoA synthetase-like isoform X1 n=1 Tax=Stegodyphus dumicola TaxID=202533 RepID=UPI0015AF57F8|nr:acetoacetyl-CoA synthetase-like isoform X1 [Stegodyphus dumicola]